MRISVKKNDPGFNPAKCLVYLDGEDITQECHTADEEEGKVWVNKKNADGKYFIESCPCCGTPNAVVAEEVLVGDVKVVLL